MNEEIPFHLRDRHGSLQMVSRGHCKAIGEILENELDPSGRHSRR